MKFLSGIAGSIVLIYLLSMDRVELFGRVCFIIGTQKKGELWGSEVSEPVCLAPAIYYSGMLLAAGLIILAVILFAKDYLLHGQSQMPLTNGGFDAMRTSQPDRQAARVPSAQTSGKPKKDYDTVRWAALLEVDEEIAAAEKAISAFGTKFVDELAQKYLALGDKAYLPALVAKISEAGRQQKMLDDAQKAQDAEKLAMVQEDQREAAARFFEEYKTEVDANGGRDAFFDKRVVGFDFYSGRSKAFQGGLRIELEDGEILLRSNSHLRRLFKSRADEQAWEAS
jgi:hypothetical protein